MSVILHEVAQDGIVKFTCKTFDTFTTPSFVNMGITSKTLGLKAERDMNLFKKCLPP